VNAWVAATRHGCTAHAPENGRTLIHTLLARGISDELVSCLLPRDAFEEIASLSDPFVVLAVVVGALADTLSRGRAILILLTAGALAGLFTEDHHRVSLDRGTRVSFKCEAESEAAVEVVAADLIDAKAKGSRLVELHAAWVVNVFQNFLVIYELTSLVEDLDAYLLRSGAMLFSGICIFTLVQSKDHVEGV